MPGTGHGSANIAVSWGDLCSSLEVRQTLRKLSVTGKNIVMDKEKGL